MLAVGERDKSLRGQLRRYRKADRRGEGRLLEGMEAVMRGVRRAESHQVCRQGGQPDAVAAHGAATRASRHQSATAGRVLAQQGRGPRGRPHAEVQLS